MPYDVDEVLQSESGRFGGKIYQNTLEKSPWNKLVPAGTWEDQMGQAISVMTYERSLPASDPTWADVDYNTGTGNTCVPTAEEVGWAQTVRQYNLQQTALQSPPLCVNDIRFALKFKEQLDICYDVLEQNTTWSWQERLRNEYLRLCDHKGVAATGLPETSDYTTGGDAIEATSTINQSILNHYYMRLNREGGYLNALGYKDGAPEHGLICSAEASRTILRIDPELRTDIRESSTADELLRPLGVTRSYDGFFHIIDMFPPRFTFSGGDYTRVPPYVGSAATQGTKFDVNPAYEAAEFELVFIFHKDVMMNMKPAPITSPGGNVKFDPQSYMGEFNWRNILHKDDNPDGDTGFFRAKLSAGSKPIKPQYGYAIMVKRSAADYELTPPA